MVAFANLHSHVRMFIFIDRCIFNEGKDIEMEENEAKDANSP